MQLQSQTLFNIVPVSRQALTSLKDWHMHLASTNQMIPRSSMLSLTKLHTPLKTNARDRTRPRNYTWSMAPTFPWLAKCYLWESLEDKLYKTNPHNLEELRNIRHEISTISGHEVHRVNNLFRQYSDCVGSGGQYFQELL